MREIRTLRSTRRGLETWQWPKIVCDTRKRTARQQGTQTPTVAGAPVLDPTTEEALVGWRAQSRKTPGGQPHYSSLAIRRL